MSDVIPWVWVVLGIVALLLLPERDTGFISLGVAAIMFDRRT